MKGRSASGLQQMHYSYAIAPGLDFNVDGSGFYISSTAIHTLDFRQIGGAAKGDRHNTSMRGVFWYGVSGWEGLEP